MIGDDIPPFKPIVIGSFYLDMDAGDIMLRMPLSNVREALSCPTSY